jgi:glycosyltransferase involved in cell wall biosynthesis
MRNGIPLVTTPTGVQGLADTADFVYATEDPQAFATEVMRLLEDDFEWRRRSELSMAFIRKRFSPESVYAVLEPELQKSAREPVAE